MCRIYLYRADPTQQNCLRSRMLNGSTSYIIQTRNLSALEDRSRSSSGNRSYRSYRSYRSSVRCVNFFALPKRFFPLLSVFRRVPPLISVFRIVALGSQQGENRCQVHCNGLRLRTVYDGRCTSHTLGAVFSKLDCSTTKRVTIVPNDIVRLRKALGEIFPRPPCVGTDTLPTFQLWRYRPWKIGPGGASVIYTVEYGRRLTPWCTVLCTGNSHCKPLCDLI